MLTSIDYMNRALFWAARGRGRTSPNPVVGAVVVSAEGVVVGQGFHERAGDAHAEVRALEMAGVRARGSTMFCTLEPCCHTGRTGPCVARIVEAGVARVVASIEDPDPRVAGRGFAFLRSRGVELEIGLGAAAAIRLNQPFFTLVREGRPFVVLKAAVSHDGSIAAAPGQRTPLTSRAANLHAQRVRAEIDAIGVGVGTILSDDPWLTVRSVYRARPLTRVVFDRRLRTPPGARLLSTRESGPVIIVTTAEGAASDERRDRLERLGAEVVVAVDGSMRAALACLGSRRLSSLLLEGGAAVHQAAWDEGLVDLVRLYVTPHVLGEAGVRLMNGRAFPAGALGAWQKTALGPDVLMEAYVHGSG